MTKPNKLSVQATLARNGRDLRLRAAIEKAWNDLKARYTERSQWRRDSTTRALMWEYSVESVIAAFEDDPGVKVIPHADTVSFIIDQTVLFRVKKAASNLITSNVATSQAVMFHEHEVDLFGEAGCQRVEVVHVFDRFRTSLEWIGVVARDGRDVMWEYELPIAGASVIELSPKVSTGPASKAVLRLIKPSGENIADEDQK